MWIIKIVPQIPAEPIQIAAHENRMYTNGQWDTQFELRRETKIHFLCLIKVCEAK